MSGILIICRAYRPTVVTRGHSLQFWQDNLQAALAMRDAGMTTIQIAARLGTTKNAVIGAFNRAGACVSKCKPRAIVTPDFPPLGGCVYPHGHKPDYRFCGAPVELGHPYCAEHHRVAYRATVQLESLLDGVAP
jgi:hypothetical protein